MLKLYQFHPKYGLPNISPFCMKVETYLRMAKIPYTNMYIDDPRKAPKRKAPYIDHDGRKISDSAFILEYLQQAFDLHIDTDFNAHQMGISRMITGALEERLYFVMLYSRWIDDTNWPAVRDTWFGKLPPIVKTVVPNMIRNNIKKTLYSQGVGRHSAKEIYHIGQRDLQGIVDVLGDQKYILGNEPHSVDTVVFAFLANLIFAPLDSPLKAFACDQLPLVDYCKRMGKTYFHEYKIFT